MHSSENNRRGQRRRPDLNINPVNSPNRGRDSVPSTPPARSKTKPPVSSRAYRVHASTASRDSDESFLDNGSDDYKGNESDLPELPRGRTVRDSHDLSLPSRQFTRDSLVTNMLSSLDQFSLGQIHTPTTNMFDDDDALSPPHNIEYTRSMTNSSRPGRKWSSGPGPGPSPGHGHGYSYSSDYEGTDDGASRISGQYSRGRRSNSSSGFQSSLGRLNSLQEHSRTDAPGTHALNSKGGKTSQSSSTNSVDVGGYAQVLTTERWAHGIGTSGGRSSSLDGQTPSLSSLNAWKSELSNTFLVDDYEAAPTPTIPGGPRRTTMPSSPALPSMPTADGETTTPDRWRAASKSRSSTMKTTQSKYTPSPRNDNPPPLPPVDIDSAPAPHVGYEKSKEVMQGGPNQQPQAKPGFFSRLFGYRNSTIPPEAKTQLSGLISGSGSGSGDSADQFGTNLQNTASPSQSQSVPPSRDSQPPPQQHHVIQKKSSFFRRRKKSVAEPPLPPPPVPSPMEINRIKDQSINTRDGSPVSSLREIMNPYLENGTSTIPPGLLSPSQEKSLRMRRYDTQDGDNVRKSRGFSPDYEPSPSATIRTVKSTSALRSQDAARRRTHMEFPTRDLPELPTKKLVQERDTTFFHDSSDEGEKPSVPTKHAQQNLQNSKSSSMATQSREELEEAGIRHKHLIRNEDFIKHEPSSNLLLQQNIIEEEQRKSMDGRNGPKGSLQKPGNGLPSVTVDGTQLDPKPMGSPIDEPEVSIGEPTEDDRQKAQKIYDGNEDFIQKEKAAAWMGEEGLVRQRTLRAYIELYDFANQSVLVALRQICSRLILRAETQQVDRILVAFSSRWCDCNPNHGFKSMDVIHTMCYSIMLLNTDLHLADIDQKMTRSQFVKNTMTTIKHALADSAPEIFDRASILPGKNSLLSPGDSEMNQMFDAEQPERPSWRTSFKPLPRPDSSMGNYFSDGPVDTCGPLVKAPFEGSAKAWTQQLEIVLKDIYVSIRDEKLPLFGAETTHPQGHPQNSLSVMSMLKRSPSVLSKAPSEGHITSRGRINDSSRNLGGSRWNSKSRSRPRFPGNGMSSSRTSFEDGNSVWSPTTSSATWSRYSLGRTQTSISMDSFSSYPYGGEFQQSIGFANALSQAIIREDIPPGTSGGQSVVSDDAQHSPMLEDESLELIGAPWVKEGMVTHKHHLDGMDKKAKERNWAEVFAVVQKGSMSLFSFSTKSMRQKARTGRKHTPGAVVGGGNWQENATSVGNFSLRQTLASSLPSPGYSRSRQNVWALSLPTGAVHLFQVGTPEIAQEFVLTVNYWSARLSTHPLVGGVSNIEYGWSDNIINDALIVPLGDLPPPRPGSAAASRSSMHSRQGSLQNSLRSSFDVGSASRTKLPGDRIHIAEWKAPAQSLRPSNLSEPEQLEMLEAYVKSLEEDLQKHNQLRSPMLLAFTPRGHNAGKAMANWERKSDYLLREIVKFRTYVDCLHHAKTKREEVYAEREVAERNAQEEEQSDAESVYSTKEEGVKIQVQQT